jgi:radical SAM protein with 4Fe4S-binding SPASM domain
MEPEIISKVVKEFASISEWQKVSLAPVGVGEPLLFSDFFNVLKQFKNIMPNVPTFVITNGITLDKENCKKMIESGIERFLISLNFNDKSSYLEYNGVDKYDVVVKNTKIFLKMKGNRNPATSIQMLDVTSNKPRFQQFIREWTPYLNPNDTATLKVCDNWTGTIDRTRFTDTKPPSRYPCPMLYSMVIVNVDGYVFPCCQGMTRGPESPVCLGNIMDKTIRQIYTQDDTIWTLRRLHEHGTYDGLPCKECFAWSMVPNIFF